VSTSLDDIAQRLRARECNCEQSQELKQKLDKMLERIEALRSTLMLLPVACDCGRCPNQSHYSDCPMGMQGLALRRDDDAATSSS
jgi:hypothetical protein